MLLLAIPPQAAGAEPPAVLLLEAAGAAAIGPLQPRPELRLEGGRTAVLADIVVPESADAAARTLLAPLLARAVVELEAPAATDRHGRLEVRARGADGHSLEAALVGEGLALVRPLPGPDEAVLAELLALEAAAAAAGRGVWRRPDAVVVGQDEAETRLGRFALVEGVILQASQQSRYFYLNFGPDWRIDTTARIDRDVLKRMLRAGFDPALLEGRTVRLRGTLFAENGPMLELWTHHGIEILP